MALKFQPPQGADTTSPNEAFNKGLGNTISNLPLIYQQLRQQGMENQIKEKSLQAQLDQNDFTQGIENKKVGIAQQEADTNKYKAENQPQFTVPVYDASGNVTGFQEVPKGFKPFGGKQPQKYDPKKDQQIGARAEVTTKLKEMRGYFEKLRTENAVVDTSRKGFLGGLKNAAISVASSGPGKLTGRTFGTSNATARTGIDKLQPLLINDIRKASSMGARGMDATKELDFYLQSVPKSNDDIDAALASIDTLEQSYGESGVNDGGSESGGEDAQALEWANANPNDPRATAIKTRLGR